MVKIDPAWLLAKENQVMAKMITNHFMKVLNCNNVDELIETCKTIIDAAKQTASEKDETD